MPNQTADAEDTAQYHEVDTQGVGLTNTINRAELCGILAALLLGHTRIATDSMCAIYQIRTAMLHPMKLLHHIHRDLLQQIVTHIERAEGVVHIYKVPAHCGVIGNEVADEIARHAADKQGGAGIGIGTGNRPLQDTHWLQQAGGIRGAPGEKLPNATTALKSHMHACHNMGTANTDCATYQRWQNIMPEADLQASNRFHTAKEINTAQMRTTLRARMNVEFTQWHAKLWGMTTDDTCPLCREQRDGINHILLGCSKLSGLHINRHNAAGRMVIAAVTKGQHGAGLVFTDVGNDEELMSACATAGAQRLRRSTLRTWLLGHDDIGEQATSYPDAVLVVPTGPHDGPATKIPMKQRKLVFIELKYSSDTNISGALDKAATQHATLMGSLKQGQHYAELQLVRIILGATGVIYKVHTRGALKELGVTGAAQDKLVNKLHVHAVQAAHQLVSTRHKAQPRKAAG